jgi:hypothetical protein
MAEAQQHLEAAWRSYAAAAANLQAAHHQDDPPTVASAETELEAAEAELRTALKTVAG